MKTKHYDIPWDEKDTSLRRPVYNNIDISKEIIDLIFSFEDPEDLMYLSDIKICKKLGIKYTRGMKKLVNNMADYLGLDIIES